MDMLKGIGQGQRSHSPSIKSNFVERAKQLGLKDAILEFLRSDCDKQIHFDGRTLNSSL